FSDTNEPVFPAALMLEPPSPVSIIGETVAWHCPTSLPELLRLKAEYPEGRIVAGNTKVGIEVKLEGMHYPVLISPSRVPELNAITTTTTTTGVSKQEREGVMIGGATSLSSVGHALGAADGTQGGRGGRGSAAGACVAMLRWFGSTQIRNVACLAGDLAGASPSSDMNALLAACGAEIILVSARAGERRVNVRDCFLGYGGVGRCC
ncbi:unnamed protein product, partial [Hapterophycus canaliculatus]